MRADGTPLRKALRQADECFEAFDFSKGKQSARVKKDKSTHLKGEEDIPWVSSYGLVLDYDSVYNRLSTLSDEERYTTKRTLKCLTGFAMSIVRAISPQIERSRRPYLTTILPGLGHPVLHSLHACILEWHIRHGAQ